MKAARLTAGIVLFFLGLSSCVGGLPLILDPSGGILKMPLTLLDHSPFHSFFIPGLILLTCNGILSLAIAIAVLRRTRNAGIWVIVQGCVLFGWITIEVIMIRHVVWSQFVYWGVALALFASGWALRRAPQPNSALKPETPSAAAR